MTLPDQPDRDRFARETGRNFSVIAPAGVGKTTAIAHRVLQLAREDAAAWTPGRTPRLSKLVVVTFTRKAADEMRDRTRGEIVRAGLPSRVLGWFNEAFFGTIHSFCFELLRRFGPLAGLPTSFTIEQDDTALRLAFQRDTPDVAVFLSEAARAAWRQFGEADAVWTLAWDWPDSAVRPPPPGPCPELDLAPVFAFKAKRKDNQGNLARAQELLRRWQAAPPDARALGLPATRHGGEEFKQLWAGALQPLRDWLAAAASCAAAGAAEAYTVFKEGHGRISYDDFHRLALRLLRDPALARRIREEEFSILLDEAQDTDPAQFAVLVGVVEPATAQGLWMEGAGTPPAPGRFSMVGDPQQSIYDRADVRAYQELHRRLLEAGAAEALEFSVTRRCDCAIVDGVNTAFPSLLNGRGGQAQFVRLRSRPGAGPGVIARLPISRPDSLPAKPNVADRLRAEARALAHWLRAAGLARLGVNDWSQIAVLSPRKLRHWMGALAAELRDAGVGVQVHADDRAPGADPARAWLGAILGVLADPADEFELCGVLREVFGISDDELFRWRRESTESPRLAGALTLLRRLGEETEGLPLRDAVALAVESTQLRARLAALLNAYEACPAALEAFLDQATLADARGDNLAGFTRELRRGPAESTEVTRRPGEAQLLTCHKAKGLEWEVVILFGMFCELEEPPPRYPRWIVEAEPGRPPACLYDKFHAQAARAAGMTTVAARRAAPARLLYVAATRPKRALIVLDALALGEDEGSLADVLGVLGAGPNRAWWNSLPLAGADFSVSYASSARLAEAASASPAVAADWPSAASTFSLTSARVRAEAFPRRVRPSTLARHAAGAEPILSERAEPDLFAPPDYPEEQVPPDAAVKYGNWWHGLMESTPWPSGPAAWSAWWRQQIPAAPDPDRARAETAQLLASPLAARLAAPGLAFAVEMPFLWAEPGGARAFDGCIDLAAWDAASGRWLVIDWKTDRLDGDTAAELRRRYGPQIEVYARALAAGLSAPVEAFLYGTRAGVLAAFDALAP